MTVQSNTSELNGSGPFYVRYTIWDTTQDVVNNRTLFEYRGYIGSSGGWNTFGINGAWSTNMGGASGGISGLAFSGAAWEEILIMSGNVWIGHNSDGTRPGFECILSVDTSHSSVGDGTVITWADAPTIPRATQPTLPSSVDAGVAFNIGVSRASTDFHHHIMYSIGSISLAEIVDNQTASTYSWTPPLSLLNQITTTTSKTLTITVDTWTSGGTFIGRKTAAMNLNVPESIVPDFTTVTNSEATAGVAANIGRYVQSISKLDLAITGAVSGGYGATISSYKIEVAGQTINAVSGTTPSVLAPSGTYDITGTVTDSRGRQKVKTVSITVLAYAPPVFVAQPSVIRSTSGGVAQEDGTHLKVFINASVSSLINTTQRNAIAYRLSIRTRNTPPWVVVTTVTPGGIAFNSSVVIGPYTATTAYDLLVEVIDDFMTSAQTLVVPVAQIFMHWDANEGVGIGKFREYGELDVNGDIYQGAGVQVEPIGVILPFAGATAPQGWLIANGSAVSRTTYAALFDLIGTTYGVGDNSTTFNLPNAKGRTLVGYDSTQAEFNVLGKTGGEKTHSQTLAEMASHQHNHNQSDGGNLSYSESGVSNQYTVSFGQGRNNTGIMTGNAGSGSPANVLQPYLTINYIIRAL